VTVRLPPLYAILDVDALAARGLEPLDVAAAWLAAGVRLIQLRAKSMSLGPMLALADELVALARRSGAQLIVNDRADVARMSGADGVHVGQDDLSPAEARRVVGSDAVVGLSTHSAVQAADACGQPISYLAIGPVFPTGSKRRPDPVVGTAGVRAAAEIAAKAGLPVVAIGGISLEQAPAVLEAGAASVAVISDLLAGEPAARARAWVEALTSR